MKILWTLIWVLTFSLISAQNEVSRNREILGYRCVMDSASNYIRLDYLELMPFRLADSLFLDSDTTCIFYRPYLDSLTKKKYCYQNYDNYVYRDVGEDLADEFMIDLRFSESDSTFKWNLNDFIRNDKRLDFFDSVRLKYE